MIIKSRSPLYEVYKKVSCIIRSAIDQKKNKYININIKLR
jgi:hypothetical protein